MTLSILIHCKFKVSGSNKTCERFSANKYSYVYLCEIFKNLDLMTKSLLFKQFPNSAPTSAIFKSLKFSYSGGAVIRSDPTDFAYLLYPILTVVLPSKYVCRH